MQCRHVKMIDRVSLTYNKLLSWHDGLLFVVQDICRRASIEDNVSCMMVTQIVVNYSNNINDLYTPNMLPFLKLIPLFNMLHLHGFVMNTIPISLKELHDFIYLQDDALCQLQT